MTLLEYIEKREEALDKQIEAVMNKDTISGASMLALNSAVTELERIKIALEDGVIEV